MATQSSKQINPVEDLVLQRLRAKNRRKGRVGQWAGDSARRQILPIDWQKWPVLNRETASSGLLFEIFGPVYRLVRLPHASFEMGSVVHVMLGRGLRRIDRPSQSGAGGY